MKVGDDDWGVRSETPHVAVGDNHSPDPMDGSWWGHLHFEELGSTWHKQVIHAVLCLIWVGALRVWCMVRTQCYQWGKYRAGGSGPASQANAGPIILVCDLQRSSSYQLIAENLIALTLLQLQ